MLSVDLLKRDRIERRLQGFQQTATDLGATYQRLVCGGLDAHGVDRTLIAACELLPPPLGIYAPIDHQGAWIREQFLRAGWHIPRDVAIIGTGDFPGPCQAQQPFLSTVAMPWRLMGQGLPVRVHCRLSGQTWGDPHRLRTLYVVARQSTEAIQPQDPMVQQAVQWMEKNLDSRSLSDHLTAHLDTSVNTLCRRFPGRYSHVAEKTPRADASRPRL